MIKTVIFDIGNVLTGFGWRDFIRSFGYSEEISERVGLATIESEDWNEYDLGNLTNEEILELFRENDPGVWDEIQVTMKHFKGILTRCDYAIPWIEELKGRGYQVLFLSNFSDRAFNECSEVLDFVEHMNGGIFSYRVHLTKPDPRIYDLILDTYELNPEECVFLDDKADNCEAARSKGINVIQFTGYESGRAALEEILEK